MNRVATAAMAALVALCCAPLQARLMLAPDANGYQMIDSAERFGPVYEFIDVSRTGKQLNLQDDSSEEIRFFPFTFYGVTYYTAFISSNGYISFVKSDDNFNKDGLAIPQAATTPGWQTPPFIAPWFDDLDPEADGAIYYEIKGDGPNRRLVVQWSVAHHNDPSVKFEFEALLFESTNKILFQYRQTNPKASLYSNGASATVGIQGNDTDGINYSASQALLTDRLAVGFAPVKYGYVGIPAPQQEKSGAPGEVVHYEVKVVNGKIAEDGIVNGVMTYKPVEAEFTVKLLPGSRWQAAVVDPPASTIKLQPNGSTTLKIDVTIPAAGAASMADDIVSFSVTDKVKQTTTTGGGGNGGTTSTQNNEKTDGTKPDTTPVISSVFNLKSLCLPAPCFQQDSDGDGVPDSGESGSSNDAARVHGFAALSGELMDIDVTGGTLHGFTVDKAVGGPENVRFDSGVFNYRILPARIGESVVVRITPATAWPGQPVLYKVSSAGKYTEIDAKKWVRVENSNAIELTLVDGADFDEDGVANGVIVDPLAIGLKATAGGGSSTGFGAGGALFDELLLLAALAGIRWRAGRPAPKADSLTATQ